MFEVFREKFTVTEWKGNSVYRTQSEGTDWFDMDLVDQNKPKDSNTIYAPPKVTNGPEEGRGIRKRK